MEPNPNHGKVVRGFKTIRHIGLQLNLPRKTFSNIVDRFVRTGSVQPGVGGNKIRTARTDDVVLYTEFCKRQRPSVYAAEVQNTIIWNLGV